MVLSNCKRNLKPRLLRGTMARNQPGSSMRTLIPVGILMLSPGRSEKSMGERKSYPADFAVDRSGRRILSYPNRAGSGSTYSSA